MGPGGRLPVGHVTIAALLACAPWSVAADVDLRVDLDPATGAVRAITSSNLGAMLSDSSATGEGFRLRVKPPDRPAEWVASSSQTPPSIERAAGEVRICWPGPLVLEGGRRLAIEVLTTLRVSGDELAEETTIANESAAVVEEVHTGFLAGRLRVAQAPTARWFLNATDVFRAPGTPLPSDYLGSYPGSMGMAWVSVDCPEAGLGLYLACYDPIPRLKTFRLEPAPTRGQGQELGRAFWAHHPHLQPGESFECPPIIARFHRGGWREAARLYARWFEREFPIPDPASSWLRRLPAYQFGMLMLPEGNVNMTYADIPRWAWDGKRFGIHAIQVAGWDMGGHDGWYPFYEPDPRLGDWASLRAAIDECHALGVKVFFFVNIQPVNVTTQWFADELHRYLFLDAAGNYGTYGWGMGTVGARKGWSHQPLATASAGFPEYRAIIAERMVKLAEIGADGLHFDKLYPAGLNYNPELRVSPDRSEGEGSLKVIDEVWRRCRAINPSFALSFESYWDRLIPYSCGSNWTWGAGPDSFAMMKYAFPEWTNMQAIAQPYDYALVNNAVLYGYTIMTGPKHLTASIGDPLYEDIGIYVREVIEVYERLREVITLGEYLGEAGAEVRAGGSVRWRMHQDCGWGRRALVIANYGMAPAPVTVESLDECEPDVILHRPGHPPAPATVPLEITLDGERLVVIEGRRLR